MFKAELRAAEVYPIFQKKRSFVFCDCILCVKYFLNEIEISFPGYPASSLDLLFDFLSKLCVL